MVPVLEHEAAILEENEIRYERIKKKGFYISYLKKWSLINHKQKMYYSYRLRSINYQLWTIKSRTLLSRSA